MIIEEISESVYSSFYDRSVISTAFASPEWLSFISQAKGVRFIFFLFSDGEDPKAVLPVGLFKKVGFKIAASPFEGWDTEEIGFSLLAEGKFDYPKAISLVVDYLKRVHHFHYFEIVDRNIPESLMSRVHSSVNCQKTPIINICKNDSDLLASFQPDGRTNVRSFERRGATFEIKSPDDSFFNDFFQQTLAVYQHRGLKSIFPKKMFESMFEAFRKMGDHVFCAAAFRPDGKCIATIVSIGKGQKAYLICLADYYEDLRLRPIEYLVYKSAIHWRDRGCRELDLSGYSDYKMKFNPNIVFYQRYIFGKKCLVFFRNFVKQIIRDRRRRLERKKIRKRIRSASADNHSN